MAGVVAFAGVSAFYAATLLPGVAYWDTGEMQTVPYVLGIAHPTGFPLFVLGGWLFSHAIPFGAPAWRLSLFSALASAAASGCLAVLVTDVTRRAPIGVAAAAVFALGEIAWTRGVRAEVHDFVLLFVALALTAAARGRLAAAALAFGLGLAAHTAVVLALPGLLLAAWPALAVARVRDRALAAVLAAGPLLLYAYVPLRSAFVEAHGLDPEAAQGVRGGAFWDTDAPSTFPALVRYVSGAAFDPAGTAERAFDRTGLAHVVGLAARTAFGEYSVLVLALVLCGVAYLALERPFVAAGLAAVGVGGLAFAANFTAESDVERYLLPGLWAAAACAGIGAWWLAGALAGERPALATVLGSALLLAGLWPAAPAAARGVARERGRADARALGPAVSRRTIPGSLVVASWSFAAPLAYDAYVGGTFADHLLCGWPRDYRGQFEAWRRRYGHVYFVLSPREDTASYARRLYATDRFAIAELRS